MTGFGGTVVLVAVVYFAACAGIATWATRRTRSANDFFLAGRGIGVWALGIAAMASSLSGFAFIGGPGLVYAHGTGAVFIVLPAAVTAALLAWTVGLRLRLLAEVRGVVTVPEAVGVRYRSRGLRRLAGIAIVVASVGYIATNFLAMGLILEVVLGVARTSAILIGAIMVVAYSAGGGMLAGVYTDLFQGLVMAGASVLVFVATTASGGGLAEQSRNILAADPGWFGPWGNFTPVAALSFFFVFGLGTLGQPHLLHKFYMLRDPARLRWYPAIMTGAMLVTLLLLVGVGIAIKAAVATGVVPPLNRPDDATTTFLLTGTSSLLAALVMSGVVAAIMSTVNAFLNISAAALTLDIPTRSPSNTLRAGRLATVVVAVAAILLALGTTRLVALLGVFGWGLFASSLVPALALGLMWEGATRAGAFASMGIAVFGTLLLESLAHYKLMSLPQGLSAAGVMLVVSLLTFLGVSWLTRARAAGELDADVRMVMRR